MSNKNDNCINSKCVVCSNFANFKCSRCKKVYYCSKDHQKSHWKQHKLLCRNYEICRNSELGRFLISDRDLERGRILIEELPLVIGPRREGCCLGCLSPLPGGIVKPTCPGCHWPMCSDICPGILKQHLPECMVLRGNTGPANSQDLRYEAILPLRCLLLQKLSPRRWQELMSMQSHSDLRKLDKEEFQKEEDEIVKYLRENYLKNITTLNDTSADLIHTICGIIEVNALDISFGGVDVQGLYQQFCLLEHSCVPNTKHTFRENDFKITATTSNYVKKGDHLSTMYSNTIAGTVARREELKATKYFSCNCQRCSDPRELGTNFSTLICLNQQGNKSEACRGDIIPINPLDEKTDWQCAKCKSLMSCYTVQDLVNSLAEQIDLVMQRNSVSTLEDLIWKLEKLVHKNHYHCYTVKHTLIQLYGREKGYSMKDLTDQQLQRKIDLCEELTVITQKLDPGGGRLAVYLGVIFYELSSALKEKGRRSGSTVDRATSLLNQCVLTLADEPKGSPGYNLLNLVKADLKAL